MLDTTIPAVQIVYGQVPMYTSFLVNSTDPGLAAGVKAITIMAGTLGLTTNVASKNVLIKVFAEIITAFDGTAPTLLVGTTPTGGELLATGDITEGTPGFYPSTPTVGLKRLIAPTTIYYSFTATGGTTGQARIYLEVMPLYVGT